MIISHLCVRSRLTRLMTSVYVSIDLHSSCVLYIYSSCAARRLCPGRAMHAATGGTRPAPIARARRALSNDRLNSNCRAAVASSLDGEGCAANNLATCSMTPLFACSQHVAHYADHARAYHFILILTKHGQLRGKGTDECRQCGATLHCEHAAEKRDNAPIGHLLLDFAIVG